MSDGFINLRPLVGVMHISHQTPEGKKAYPTEIPQFGLGVFLMSDGGEGNSSVLAALTAGYSHIDTASL